MDSNVAVRHNRPYSSLGDALNANTHVVVCLSEYGVWQRIIEAHNLAIHFEDTCIIQLTTGTIDDVRVHAFLVRGHGGRQIEGADLG